MHHVRLRDAKANLSAVIDDAQQGRPSVITRHGRPAAVVLSFEEWQRLSRVPSFGRLLMAPPLEPDDLPDRRDGLRDAGLQSLYLVDTNVLSAGAPTKADPAKDLVTWMHRNSTGLRISVITVAAIQDGIARSRRGGAGRKAERLSDWLDALLHLYAAQAVPIDLLVARKIGVMADLARSLGHAPGLADLAIAAMARCYGWTVLTRNVRHFAPLAVSAWNPFGALPDG